MNADAGLCYIPFGGKEYSRNEYEVLCGAKGTWVQCSQDTIPKNAFIGGKADTGETLYIGRVKHENTLTIGKVKPSVKACIIPYKGKEFAFPDYEIFCY